MKVVVDASVAIKWVLGEKPDESDREDAKSLLAAIDGQGLDVFAPPHWHAEIMAVVARLWPANIDPAMLLLSEINADIVTSPASLVHASRISADLDHHLFDTLYHAVALEVGATLVTADERYYNNARKLGSIVLLRGFTVAL